MLFAFLTNDLVFPSRIRPVAQRLGARLETGGNIENLIANLADAPDEEFVVLLDLNAANIDPAAAISRLKSLPHSPRAIVAFGPHVHEAKLAAARAAGCDLVLTRGQFDAQMDSLFEQFVASPR